VLEIIGAGLGRTGTHSLAAALELLGFGPVYHIYAFAQHPEDLPIWQAALDGRPVAWDALFNGYRSSVEWPGVAFFPQLLAAYPDARVILTTRDPEGWFESINHTVFDGLQLSAFNPDPQQRARSAFSRELILQRTFAGKFRDRDYAIRVYETHNALVRQLTPPENLLEFKVREGWAPLCGFLDVPVPDDPFPRSNDRSAFLETEPAWAKAARRKLGL